MSFLEGKVDALSSDIKDPYTLAITSYALSLVGSTKKIKALKELRKMAIEKGKGNKYLFSFMCHSFRPSRGLPQGKVTEKRRFFKVREKSGNFVKSQRNYLISSKSAKSQGLCW